MRQSLRAIWRAALARLINKGVVGAGVACVKVPVAQSPTYIIMHATQLPSSLLNNPDAFPVWYQVWELHSFDVLARLIK